MRVSLKHETDHESGVANMVRLLQAEGFEEKLSEDDYGEGVTALCCSVRCLSHSCERRNAKILNGTIHVPVDLDYAEFGAVPEPERKKTLGTRINDKVRQALARLPTPATFDAARFLGAHKAFLRRKGWL